MDPQLWQQVREIVGDALELDSHERRAFVRAACRGDSSLEAHIRGLLGQAERRSILDQPIFSLRRPLPTEIEDDWAGRQVGPFRLRKLLGRGGMGSVYLAEHAAGDYDEEVAIKLLRPGWDSGRFVRLLRRERRILRSLIHPYIARFLEAGTTDAGLPFLAMQRVTGVPIDQFCDQQRLGVRQRLQLFQKVCEAVQFAHRKLVVHCDLKPANILVTADGQPRLLDFGIAKILGEDAVEPRHFLTSRYASPEQVRRTELSTATDVHALGLVLYELLTGRPAHPLESDDFRNLAEVICELPPCPTSQAVSEAHHGASAQRRRRVLRGDLDSIVLKALEKEPGERYRSVEALAKDLRRFLDLRPVEARPHSPWYLSGKFIRRRRGLVATLLLLCVFGLWLLRQGLEIARQNELLERQNAAISRERDRATGVLEFLVDFLRAPDPGRKEGSKVTVREALHQAAERLDRQLRHEPAVRAELLDAIGRVFTNLALYDEAEPLLNQALEARREAFGSGHPRVAESLHNLAHLKRRQSYRDTAEQLRKEAVAIQRAAFPEGDERLALGLNGLASLLRDRRALDEAEALAGEALEIQVRLLGHRHVDVAYTLNTLASVSRYRGQLERALELYGRSLEIFRNHFGSVHRRVAQVLNNRALVYVEQGELARGVDEHREALAMRRQIFDGDHPEIVTSLGNLPIALSLHGQHAEALAVIDDALAMHARLDGTAARGNVLQLNRASVLEGRGAADCLEAIEDLLPRLEQAGRARQADGANIRGGCLVRSGRPTEAEPILLQSYHTLGKLLGEHA